MSEPGEVTQLLLDWSDGNRAALDRLMPVVYEELRRVARVQLRKERPGHLLQTTALVHEVYLRLIDYEVAPEGNRFLVSVPEAQPEKDISAVFHWQNAAPRR